MAQPPEYCPNCSRPSTGKAPAIRIAMLLDSNGFLWTCTSCGFVKKSDLLNQMKQKMRQSGTKWFPPAAPVNTTFCVMCKAPLSGVMLVAGMSLCTICFGATLTGTSAMPGPGSTQSFKATFKSIADMTQQNYQKQQEQPKTEQKVLELTDQEWTKAREAAEQMGIPWNFYQNLLVLAQDIASPIKNNLQKIAIDPKGNLVFQYQDHRVRCKIVEIEVEPT